MGILHVLYLDAGAEEPGVYYVRSPDGGEAWEAPVLISDPKTVWSQAIQRYAFDLLAIGDTVHAAWVPTDSGKVYYAQGLDHGKDWSSPQQMLQLREGTWPNIVHWDDGGLLLLVTGALPGDTTICYKLQNTSQDGGASWNVRHILMPHVRGCLGMINVVRAYDGSHHLITSAYRSEDLQLGGIYYSVWEGEDWRAPQRVTGPGMTATPLGTQIDFPSGTISGGNILHVVFHVDEGRIWYLRRQLPSPPAPRFEFPAPATEVIGNADSASTPTPEGVGEELVEVVPVIIDTPVGTPQPTPTPIATRTHRQVSRFDSQLSFMENEMFPIVLSVLTSGILVAVTLAFSLGRRRLR
jgi:hypothetical protein